MASETAAGEHRKYAKRLRPGDRVLRSQEDAQIGPFTVATIQGGYGIVAIGMDGKAYEFNACDSLIVEG